MLQAARLILQRRRLSADEFGDDMFGEPAWEMLLELYVREGSGASTTSAELFATTRTPQSTAERWLRQLEADGLLYRRSHAVEPSTDFVELSDRARASLERYFVAISGL